MTSGKDDNSGNWSIESGSASTANLKLSIGGIEHRSASTVNFQKVVAATPPAAPQEKPPALAQPGAMETTKPKE